MQILGPWSRPRLDAWHGRPFWPATAEGPQPGDNADVYAAQVGVEAPGPPAAEGPHARLAAALLAYRVFPPALVTAVLDRTPVQVGDTVGARYHLLPGIDLFFAARVVARFDAAVAGEWRTGFTYRTLVGHPELGEESFSAVKDLATGVVGVELRAWSRPGTHLARAFAPLARRLQVRASRAALAHAAGGITPPEGGRKAPR